jgi:hypothetical protein
MASRIVQIVWAGFLLIVAAVGVLVGFFGLVELIDGDVVRVSLLVQMGVGFGVGITAGTLAVGYVRGAFTHAHPPGAA